MVCCPCLYKTLYCGHWAMKTPLSFQFLLSKMNEINLFIFSVGDSTWCTYFQSSGTLTRPVHGSLFTERAVCVQLHLLGFLVHPRFHCVQDTEGTPISWSCNEVDARGHAFTCANGWPKEWLSSGICQWGKSSFLPLSQDGHSIQNFQCSILTARWCHSLPRVGVSSPTLILFYSRDSLIVAATPFLMCW